MLAVRRAPEHDPPMVGRAAELAALLDLLARARTETPTVLIAGEAGIGKTRLVEEWARSARDQGALVLVGGAMELSGDPIPYAPLVEILRRLRRLVDTGDVELPPEARVDLDELLTSHDLNGGRARLFERVLSLFDGLTRTGRVVGLIFEDIHWADQATLDLVSFLDRNHAPGQLLVLTARPEDLGVRPGVRDLVATITRGRHAHRLELQRLNRDTVAQLLEEMPGASGAADPDWIFERSGGNPFLAVELAADPTRQGLPGSVQDVLLARASRVRPATARVLEVAAVAGRPVRHELLLAGSGLSDDGMRSAVREAMGAGLFVPAGPDGDYAFRHVLMAEAILSRLLPAERRALHEALAGALETDPTASSSASLAAEVATHWYVAGRADRALPTAAAAGRLAAGVYAYAEAWRQLSRAVEMAAAAGLSADSAEVRALWRDAAESAHWVGDAGTALALTRAALKAEDDPQDRAELLEQIADILWDEGNTEDAHEALAEAEAITRGRPESRLSATIRAASLHLQLLAGDHEAVLEPTREAIALAQRVGASAAEGRARVTRGMALSFSGAVDEGAEEVARGHEMLTRHGDLDDRRRASSNLSFALLMAGRTGQACDVALEGLAFLRRHGLTASEGAALSANTIVLLRLTGRWAQARALCEELLGKDLPRNRAGNAHLVLAELDIVTDRLPEARVALDTAWRLIDGNDRILLQVDLDIAEAELADARGLPSEALERVESALRALPVPAPAGLEAQVLALGLRVAAGRASPTRRSVDQARGWWHRLARLSGSHSPEVAAYIRSGAMEWARLAPEDVSATHGRAVGPAGTDEVGAGHGDGDDARDIGGPGGWLAAAWTWEGLQRPLEASYAYLAHAEDLLIRRHARAAVEPHLRRGYELAAALPSRRLLHRADDLARRARLNLGEAPAEPPSSTVPTDPWERFGLTAREREVLGHLMAGATNREIGELLFLSPRTVGVHVSNVLRKLDVSTRGQAAARASAGLHQRGERSR